MSPDARAPDEGGRPPQATSYRTPVRLLADFFAPTHAALDVTRVHHDSVSPSAGGPSRECSVRTAGSTLECRENRVCRGQRRPVIPHVLPLDPLRLLRRLVVFPVPDVPLDLAEHGLVLAPVEVLEERADVCVVVERLPSGELVPPSRRASNRLIAGFDYPQNRVFRLSQFGSTMRMEAAGIEPASAAAPAERLQA